MDVGDEKGKKGDDKFESFKLESPSRNWKE